MRGTARRSTSSLGNSLGRSNASSSDHLYATHADLPLPPLPDENESGDMDGEQSNANPTYDSIREERRASQHSATSSGARVLHLQDDDGDDEEDEELDYDDGDEEVYEKCQEQRHRTDTVIYDGDDDDVNRRRRLNTARRDDNLPPPTAPRPRDTFSSAQAPATTTAAQHEPGTVDEPGRSATSVPGYQRIARGYTSPDYAEPNDLESSNAQNPAASDPVYEEPAVHHDSSRPPPVASGRGSGPLPVILEHTYLNITPTSAAAHNPEIPSRSASRTLTLVGGVEGIYGAVAVPTAAAEDGAALFEAAQLRVSDASHMSGSSQTLGSMDDNDYDVLPPPRSPRTPGSASDEQGSFDEDIVQEAPGVAVRRRQSSRRPKLHRQSLA